MRAHIPFLSIVLVGGVASFAAQDAQRWLERKPMREATPTPAAPTPEPPWLTDAWTPELEAKLPAAPAALDPHAAACPGMTSADAATTTSADPHREAQHRLRHQAAEVGPVSMSSAENGHAVAELFSAVSRLASTRVRVRGVVVQVNDGILQRNFVHLRDGTGSPSRGDHDLTLTTTDHFEVGEEVEVEGVLVGNRDFGLGYAYPALLEQAQRM